MTGRREFTLRDRLGLVAPVIRTQSHHVGMIVGLSILAALLSAALPWPIKFLIDHALGSDAPSGSLSAALNGLQPATLVVISGIALFALHLCISGTAALLDWFWDVAGQRMVYDLTSRTLNILQRKSLTFHMRQTPGDLLNRISVDCWCGYTFASQLLVTPMKSVLTILAIAVAACTLSITLTAVLLLITPLLAFSVWHFGPTIKRMAHEKRAAEAAISRETESALSAIPVVQTYTLIDRNIRRYDENSARTLSAAISLAWDQNRFTLLNSVAFAAAIALITLLAAGMVRDGLLSIGGMLVFLAYIETLKNNFLILLNSFSATRAVESSIERLLELSVDGEDMPERPGAPSLILASDNSGPEIVFEHVSFAYDEHARALRDINIRIAPGETLALVGETGGGKSTFSAMVPRFFDPLEGRITIDGQDLRDVSVSSLRDKISIVLQDPFLLPFSIAENIAFARPGAGREEIRSAAWAASAVDFIEALEDGYDTVIGENGLTLSGGQRQRIAIARALLKDAPVLILDEPTSALDPDTEQKVVTAIERVARARTTIVIAHRLSTIRNADRVAVFDNGRIAELGHPAELLQQDGKFRRYCELQDIRIKADRA